LRPMFRSFVRRVRRTHGKRGAKAKRDNTRKHLSRREESESHRGGRNLEAIKKRKPGRKKKGAKDRGRRVLEVESNLGSEPKRSDQRKKGTEKQKKKLPGLKKKKKNN